MKFQKPLHPLESKKPKVRFLFYAIFALVFSTALLLIYKSLVVSLIALPVTFILLILFSFLKTSLERTDRINKIEAVFPDFLGLMSSNLRAGMTIDRAMLLSARPEFKYLDAEISRAGREITTGKSVEHALLVMAERIGSNKISKTIYLIISGIKSGGNIAVLLEETASNMRERGFVEKRAASSVMMYVIFIFLAIAIFAPGLFALSNILVEILTKIFSTMPETSTLNLPFAFSKISITTSFINNFSLLFIISLDIMAALVLGLINKGEEKQGVKYLIPLLLLSLGTFFLLKILLRGFLSSIV